MSSKPLVAADTSPEADRVYRDVLKKLGGARRVDMAFEMSNNVRAIAETGVRQRHPEYNNAEVQKSVARILLGEDLFRECFPDCDIEP